jgi:hypothetical protein
LSAPQLVCRYLDNAEAVRFLSYVGHVSSPKFRSASRWSVKTPSSGPALRALVARIGRQVHCLEA